MKSVSPDNPRPVNNPRPNNTPLRKQYAPSAPSGTDSRTPNRPARPPITDPPIAWRPACQSLRTRVRSSRLQLHRIVEEVSEPLYRTGISGPFQVTFGVTVPLQVAAKRSIWALKFEFFCPRTSSSLPPRNSLPRPPAAPPHFGGTILKPSDRGSDRGQSSLGWLGWGRGWGQSYLRGWGQSFLDPGHLWILLGTLISGGPRGGGTAAGTDRSGSRGDRQVGRTSLAELK
jgi:hypothetical protein